jgi:hypothetical protein
MTLNAEKLIVFYNLEQLSASNWMRVALVPTAANAVDIEGPDFHSAPSAGDARDKVFCGAGDCLQMIGGRKAGNRLARLQIVVAVLQPEHVDLV